MRKIKYLFTVPDGEKVTEKHFGRVFISSICSILICMVCLVSTTWAWYTVSVENVGNTIKMGTFQVDYEITPVTGYTVLNTVSENDILPTDITDGVCPAGAYNLTIFNAGDVDGYCRIMLTPLSSATTNDSDESLQQIFKTEQIPQGESVSFMIILSEWTKIEVGPVWGTYESLEEEKLLGSLYSVSGSDIISMESGVNYLTTVSGGDVMTENGILKED